MRALAEFIMRGRPQACLVALVGVIVPLIGPASVGLVTLRKGSFEGALVALWATLPFFVLFRRSVQSIFGSHVDHSVGQYVVSSQCA